MESNSKYIEKLFFFISNIIIINLLVDKNISVLFSIWLFTILIIKNIDNLKRIMLFFIPAVLFILPLILVQGVVRGTKGLYFEIEYKFLFKNIISITAMIIYVSSTNIKELCLTMKKMKVPDYLVEILIYMQKFINMMFTNYKECTLAYRSRGEKIKIKKFSEIIVTVLKNSFYDLHEMKLSLYSRGYSGTYRVFLENSKISYVKLLVYPLYVFVIVNLQKYLIG